MILFPIIIFMISMQKQMLNWAKMTGYWVVFTWVEMLLNTEPDLTSILFGEILLTSMLVYKMRMNILKG